MIEFLDFIGGRNRLPLVSGLATVLIAIGATVSVILSLTSLPFSPDEAPTPTGSPLVVTGVIESPTDGAVVGGTFTLRGVSQNVLDANSAIWVGVQVADTAEVAVQGPVLLTAEGAWQREIFAPSGSDRIMLLAVTEEINEQLITSLQLGQPLQFSVLPIGSLILDEVTVSVAGPTLLVDGGLTSVRQQLVGAFNFTGENYTPGGSVRRFVQLEAGSPSELSPLIADSEGRVAFLDSPTCDDESGERTVWLVDESGQRSNDVRQVIATSSFCTEPK
jgi:hypothetical protein